MPEMKKEVLKRPTCLALAEILRQPKATLTWSHDLTSSGLWYMKKNARRRLRAGDC